MDGMTYYSVVKIEGDLVYLDADGMTVCASLDKFAGAVHETDLVFWQGGRFVIDTERTESTKKELHQRTQRIAKK